MGFLIFAYRKLFLQRKINDLNFQSLLLSQKKQQITQQISLVQEAISSAKNMTNVMSQSNLAGMQQSIMAKYVDAEGNPIPQKDKDGKEISASKNEYKMMQEMQLEQNRILATNYTVGSIFDAVDKAQLTQLNALDSQISMQIANIDSQTKQLQPELESVTKAETEAAKSEAPKFGLG